MARVRSATTSSTRRRSTPASPSARSAQVTSPLDCPAGRCPADARPLPRPAVEVADIFRHRGPAWRVSHAGHVSLGQLQVMSAIEHCRSAAFGGHVGAARTAGTRALPTTRALWAKPVMGSWRQLVRCPAAVRRQLGSPLRGTLQQRDQRHCQLSRPWYARCVGGAAARVGRSFARLLCCPL